MVSSNNVSKMRLAGCARFHLQWYGNFEDGMYTERRQHVHVRLKDRVKWSMGSDARCCACPDSGFELCCYALRCRRAVCSTSSTQCRPRAQLHDFGQPSRWQQSSEERRTFRGQGSRASRSLSRRGRGVPWRATSGESLAHLPRLAIASPHGRRSKSGD